MPAMTSAMRNFLFITWDGPNTSYLEGLFLPIFMKLKDKGFTPHVLQFSWGSQSVHDRRASLCAAAGIPYRHVPVLRRVGGPGALLTACLGGRHIHRAVKDWQIDTLIPRSLMPALAVLRMSRLERSALSLVFDADGLAADERVDFAGLSPHSLVYRLLRDIEAEMLRQADAVLCRTGAAKEILLARAGAGVGHEIFHVVLNGKDSVPFVEALKKRKATKSNKFRLCYSGSIGAQYRLPEMLELAAFLKKSIPHLTFDIFSPDTIRVDGELRRFGLAGSDWISSRSLAAEAVPSALVECDLALALRQPSFSMQAVQPIKIGEYLMAGLPVIGTPEIGDTKPLISEGVFRSAEKEERERTLRWIVDKVIPAPDNMRALCHDVGRKYFSIQEAADRYAAALEFPAER